MSNELNMSISYKPAFLASRCYSQYGELGLILFTLGLRFDIDDIDYLATECLTDGPADRKIDALYIDEDTGTGVIIQHYFSKDEAKSEAPANKASDLNTAVTWAISLEESKLPSEIKPFIVKLRNSILNDEVDIIEIWYVHNLPESINVEKELDGVEQTLHAALKTRFRDKKISINVKEYGNRSIEHLFIGQNFFIKIPDTLKLFVSNGFEIQKSDWKSFITSINANWLFDAYNRYGQDLFNANIRGYLGNRRSRGINQKIIETCLSDADNFWAYHNGITCWVDNYSYDEGKLTINGLSIINGAQTTGAIGSLPTRPADNILVPARFIKCEKPDVLKKIIEYNNTQNYIEPADFRSHDEVQKRLVDEFSRLSGVVYLARRGPSVSSSGYSPGLEQLSRDTVAQALTAFHGESDRAYNHRKDIWIQNSYYNDVFNEKTTAKHIIFIYSLLKTIEDKKRELLNKDSTSGFESRILEYLRERGSILFLMEVIGYCIEIIINEPIPDKFNLSFGRATLSESEGYWKTILDTLLSFVPDLKLALEQKFKKDIVTECKSRYQSNLNALISMLPDKKIINDFRTKISIA